MLGACLARFFRNENGAVIVDWVALTGAVIGLAVLILLDVVEGATSVSDRIGAEMDKPHISDITDLVSPPAGSTAAGGPGSMAP